MQSFWIHAEKDPSRPALIGPAGEILSAGELARSAHRLVHGLRARGLAAGDVVASLLPNGVRLVEVLLAAMQAGWHYTPVNGNLTAGEVAHILGDSGCAAPGAACRPVHAIHLRDDGASQGRAPADPRDGSGSDGGCDLDPPGPLRHRAGWGSRASGHLAPVSHGAALLRLLCSALRTHVGVTTCRP